MKIISDEELIEATVHRLYKGGKGNICEICRMRGIKKMAYGERKIDGIDYFLCWDCCIDELHKKDK
jgi:hypothetical protein